MSRKTAEELRLNILALLTRDRETPSALARAMGKHRSWMTRFLNRTRSELELADIDKIADYFHVTPYALMKPETGSFTDRRRVRGDRRTTPDRRVSDKRAMLATAAELARVRPPSDQKGRDVPTAADDPIARIIEQAARDINRLRAPVEDTGRQVAVARHATPGIRHRARAAGGSADSARPTKPVKPK